jgi:hypothetical protein
MARVKRGMAAMLSIRRFCSWQVGIGAGRRPAIESLGSGPARSCCVVLCDGVIVG